MVMNFKSIVFIILYLTSSLNAEDLYPSYNLTVEPEEILEWSENRALAYIATVRLFDYDHYIYQYRRYPCQYFYTDEIQLYDQSLTINECLLNTTTGDYDYSFQLHLDSRHVEPYILRNVALECNYTNCSLSLLNITYINIGWNFKGRQKNPNCSFDIHRPYYIYRTPYTISEVITLRCKSSLACNQAQLYLEKSFTANIQLLYGSAYELEVPYCSLEKNVNYVLNKNFAETNRLLQQLLKSMQRKSG